MRSANKLIRDERGATAIEYGLIMALIFLAIVGGVQAFTDKTIAMWGNVSNNIETAG